MKITGLLSFIYSLLLVNSNSFFSMSVGDKDNILVSLTLIRSSLIYQLIFIVNGNVLTGHCSKCQKEIDMMEFKLCLKGK